MNCSDNVKNHRVRNDIILVAVVMLAAVLGFVYLNFFRSAGESVTVTVDGEFYGVYDLSDDIAVDIYSDDEHTNYNRLIISGGTAYMEKASCPDGICVSHKSIYRNGESIVCLPNRVVVSVTAKEATNEPDVVI